VIVAFFRIVHLKKGGREPGMTREGLDIILEESVNFLTIPHTLKRVEIGYKYKGCICMSSINVFCR
jgi:hypothetical protein